MGLYKFKVKFSSEFVFRASHDKLLSDEQATTNVSKNALPQGDVEETKQKIRMECNSMRKEKVLGYTRAGVGTSR